MMINPAFLQTFVALAEQRSFTRTASLLRMTQPGVSQHLKWLEDYFGTTLASRDRKLFELTDAGQRLYDYATSLFAEHERFRTALGNDEPTRGLCRFASPGSFGMKMYSFLLELNQAHPDLAMHFAYAPNPSIVKDVVEERIDVGFVTKAPDDAAVEATAFAEERLCLALPRAVKKLSWAKLQELGFINHPDGYHHAGRLLLQNFPDDYRGMEAFKVRGFSNQITRILEPVALGLGFTALPEYACRAFPGKERLRIEPLAKPVVDPIFWIQKRGRQLPSRFRFIREAYLQKEA